MARFAQSICIVIGFAAAGLAQAQAGDLPSRNSYPPAPAYGAPQANFTGAYVGAHAGGGFGSVGSADTSGMVGGVQGGYNYQLQNNVVLGGEADISASGVSNNSYAEKTRQGWLGSARVRAGYAVNNIMPYVTGGVAVGNTEIKNVAGGKTSSTNGGWVLGAGGEMLLNQNLTIRAEYLYYRLGDADFPSSAGLIKVDNSMNVLRGGINYKF
jgi:outer membrane immunogenic protein